MGENKQIWYLEGSKAAKLVSPLRASFDLRPFTSAPQDNSNNPARAEAIAGHFVVVTDMKNGVVALPPQCSDFSSNFRGIGVTPPPAGNRSTLAPASPAPKRAPAILAYISANGSPEEIEKTLALAFENIELAERERISREALEDAEREREQLNEIGVALSSQRDIQALLNLILAKTREITRADAGSLYLVEDEGEGKRHLRFMLTQNDSVEFPFQEFVLPLAEDSMAGYTALRGEVLNFADAHNLPPDLPFHFNDRYDRESGYRTRSLLTLPMRNAQGEVLAVLQLINSKRNPSPRLRSDADVAK